MWGWGPARRSDHQEIFELCNLDHATWAVRMIAGWWMVTAWWLLQGGQDWGAEFATEPARPGGARVEGGGTGALLQGCLQ